MNNDFEDLEKLVYGLFAGAAVLIGLIVWAAIKLFT
jgi:hypothetical protein